MSGLLPGLLAVFAPILSSAEAETPLQRVTLLSRSGASDLALRVLNELQPPPNNTQHWVKWEKLRFDILQQRKEWHALIERVKELPAELPLLQQQELLADAVKSLLPSGQGAAARRILRELLWRSSGDSRQISNWRRLIIRSYLEQEDGLDDARIAMQRYLKEYLPNDADWAYLYGRILLLSGKPRVAASRLATVHTYEGRLLRLTARLRAGIDDPAILAGKARKLLNELPERSKLRPRVWGLLAEIGTRSADRELRVRALEQFIGRHPGKDELFVYTPDDLWLAYRELAEEVGNAGNFLIGDPAPWLSAAANKKESSPATYRAVHALLALNSDDSAQRQRFYLRVYTELKDMGLHDAAVRLFRDSSHFASEREIPDAVRHLIVQYAIVRRDIPLAARMAQGLEQPGVRQDDIDWALIRARLELFTGRFESGVGILHQLLDQVGPLDQKTADRVMQVLFDVQSVDRQQDAYALFEKMRELVTEDSQKREVLFWMADALNGSKRYEEAAEMYFRSALYGKDSYDIWGQTARYRAAEALAENGSLNDARQVYENLLKITTDPKRVLTLERKLQGLWLKDQQQKN